MADTSPSLRMTVYMEGRLFFKHTLMKKFSIASILGLALALVLTAPRALAGMDETLKAIQQSEFSFARSSSQVPFAPLGWLQDRQYGRADFKDPRGVLPGAVVVENTFDFGTVLPAHVARRDMFLLGGDVAWDNLDVRSGAYRDQEILRVTPVSAWLHQYGAKDLLAAFAAPIFSRELKGDQPWGTSGYGGLVGLHWYSDQLQLLYGGVYSNTFGRDVLYPYLGVMWLPRPDLSLSLVFPWPTLTYSPDDRWLFQVGVAPGGSQWVRRGNGFESTQSFGSWILNTGAGYRFQGKFWLVANVGVAGLRGVDIEISGQQSRLESRPGPVFTLAVQFRP
jgi:hypothetical protein